MMGHITGTNEQENSRIRAAQMQAAMEFDNNQSYKSDPDFKRKIDM